MTALSGGMMPVMVLTGMTIGHSRPFGGVHGEECDGFFLRIRPPFDRARLVGPCRRHRLSEGAQAAHRVGRRQAEIEIDIGERPLGLPAMALEEDRTDAHHVHRLRQQFVRGRAVAAPVERLQLLDDLARERMCDGARDRR